MPPEVPTIRAFLAINGAIPISMSCPRTVLPARPELRNWFAITSAIFESSKRGRLAPVLPQHHIAFLLLTRFTVPGVAFLVVPDVAVQVFQILGPAALNRFQTGGNLAAALCW